MYTEITLLDMYQFETYKDGFLDLESPNFPPKHGFLCSIQPEIFRFLSNKAAIFIFGILLPSFNFSR